MAVPCSPPDSEEQPRAKKQEVGSTEFPVRPRGEAASCLSGPMSSHKPKRPAPRAGDHVCLTQGYIHSLRTYQVLD